MSPFGFWLIILFYSVLFIDSIFHLRDIYMYVYIDVTQWCVMDMKKKKTVECIPGVVGTAWDEIQLTVEPV